MFIIAIMRHLDYVVGDHPAVLGVHPGSVGVEDPGDSDLNPGALVVSIGQGLRHPLALVIAGAGPYRVNIAPVGLRLWMHLGISVHLKLS